MFPIYVIGQTADKFDNQENLYENYINLADSMFQLKDFEKSLEFYEKAISIFPKEMYPKEKIAVLTKLIEFNNSNSLIGVYPEGVTEKIYEKKNSNGELVEVTILRIVNKGDEYKKISNLTDSTTVFYKNNILINSKIWKNETN